MQFHHPGQALPRACRLDLAKEACAALRGDANIELEGVTEEVRQTAGVQIHTVTIVNEQGAEVLRKPMGRYITMELSKSSSAQEQEQVVALVAEELCRLLPSLENKTLLLVGLGNDRAVPDSLGPKVVQNTYATRHIFAESTPDGLGKVCAIAPGVLGQSGIETAEIVKGVCDHLQPGAVIVIDALAAASVSRVGNTIQMTDSGISPGSGVGSKRPRLNRSSLHCPVVAIGVPTIVDTGSIIRETFSALAEHWKRSAQILPPDLNDAACDFAENQLLSTFRGKLMVTPKDIDDLIADMAEIIAGAIAIAVHPSCTGENYLEFIR